MKNAITRMETEQLVATIIGNRLKEDFTEFARTQEENKQKEFPLREITEIKFDTIDKRFKSLQQEMDVRFDVVNRKR